MTGVTQFHKVCSHTKMIQSKEESLLLLLLYRYPKEMGVDIK